MASTLHNPPATVGKAWISHLCLIRCGPPLQQSKRQVCTKPGPERQDILPGSGSLCHAQHVHLIGAAFRICSLQHTIQSSHQLREASLLRNHIDNICLGSNALEVANISPDSHGHFQVPRPGVSRWHPGVLPAGSKPKQSRCRLLWWAARCQGLYKPPARSARAAAGVPGGAEEPPSPNRCSATPTYTLQNLRLFLAISAPAEYCV